MAWSIYCKLKWHQFRSIIHARVALSLQPSAIACLTCPNASSTTHRWASARHMSRTFEKSDDTVSILIVGCHPGRFGLLVLDPGTLLLPAVA